MERRYDLDWLRVIAFGLLMLFHTGMMFSTWDWHIKNLETSDYFDLVMRFVHQWRMPLLFFISGSAIWFAMDRYSAARYFLERQKRLLIPLVFGMLVIIPPQVYVERLFGYQKFDSFWDFYQTVFTSGPYPGGNLSWHHLWYLPYIWVYSMLTLPLCLLLRAQAGRSLLKWLFGWLSRPWCLFLVFLPSAICDTLVRPYYPGDHMNLFADWGNFCHKLTFFVIGFGLASAREVYDRIAQHRRQFLLAAIVSLAGIEMIWQSHMQIPASAAFAYHLLNNFLIWMCLLSLLGYGKRYLSFNSRGLRYANDAVYPFYILHQTVIVALGYQLVHSNWSIPLKFLTVVIGTFLVTWLIYEFLISRLNVLRVVFGMKPVRHRPPDAGTGPGQRVAPSESSAAMGSGKVTGAREPAPASSQTRLCNLTVLGSTGALLIIAVLVLGGCKRQSGRLVSHSIISPSLASNVMGISSNQQIAVYLPPSYGERSRRFPVLYLLPNFKHNLWRYTGGSFQGFRIKEALDTQIRKGRICGIIVVIPNVNHWLGGSWYRNSPLTGKWEDFIVSDLVAYVDAHFLTVASAGSRAVAGHGMGGTGALELALKHPDVFGSVYALSPALFDQNGLQDLGAVGPGMLEVWREASSQWTGQPEAVVRRRFRNFLQMRLNSPDRQKFVQGLCISYAAAVAPDLQLPFPHIAFPAAGSAGSTPALVRARFEAGFGDWENKVRAYLTNGSSLSAITIEYGGDGEYDWIRNGAKHVSGVMRANGVSNELVSHYGGHDGRLGDRLREGMLPAIAKTIKSSQ